MKIMKKLVKLYIAAFLSAVSVMSCTDLDEAIHSEITNENFYSSKSQIISAYLAPYAHLSKIITQYTQVNEMMSDEYLIPMRGIHNYGGGSYRLLHWHKWTADESWTSRPWDNLYKGIGLCNSVLADFESIDLSRFGFSAEDIARMKAEIRMMRGLYYFYLLDTYGNIPVTTVVGENYPATKPRSEVFAWLEAEIKGQIPHLHSKETAGTYGLFTTQAAYALLAKLYLNAGVYTGNERWEDCLAACDQVKGMQLEAGWQTPFMPRNENSIENIFVVPFDEVNVRGNELLARGLHYEHQKTYKLKQKPWNAACTPPDFYAKFGPEDLRINQWLTGLQTYDSMGVQKPLLGTEERKGKPLIITVNVTSMVASAEDEGARNVKYAPEAGADPAHMNNDFVILRYADVLMMKAECLLRKDRKPEAVELVNTVRKRAFRADDPQAKYTTEQLTLDEFLDERGREFCWEGWRRNDLIRFDKFNDVRWDKEKSEPFRKLFPIPNAALSVNKNLEQNEGYR